MGLGALRFILSLLVMDAHFGGFREYLQPRVVHAFGVDNVAYVGEGGIAVTGFFVISGYVIAYVLGRKYDTATARGIATFYLGRALRIYPLYFLVFGLYWMALAMLGNPPAMGGTRLLANLTLVPYGVLALFPDQNRFGPVDLTQSLLIAPAWTLTLDLLLYLLAPPLFTRRSTTWAVWCLGLAYFLAFAVLSDTRPPVWYGYFYATAMPYVFAFATGALIYHYRHFGAPPRFIVPVAVVLLLAVAFFPIGMTNTPLNQLVAVFCFGIWVAALAGKKAHAWDRPLGELTYGSYLLHVPLLMVFGHLGVRHPAPWAW